MPAIWETLFTSDKKDDTLSIISDRIHDGAVRDKIAFDKDMRSVIRRDFRHLIEGK